MKFACDRTGIDRVSNRMPEVEVSASSSELVNLGKTLRNVRENVEIDGKLEKSEFYPISLKSMIVRVKGSKEVNDVVRVYIESENLIFEGSSLALANIGEGLDNYFDSDSQEGDHLHLDRFDSNILTANSCSLIFCCS